MTCINSLIIAALVVTGAQHLSAQQPGGATTPSVPAARPDVLTTIKGNAVDSTDRQLGNTVVRLRDARVGKIVETQLTDKAGAFAFKAMDPGSYIVEVMASDQTVLTASQLINRIAAFPYLGHNTLATGRQVACPSSIQCATIGLIDMLMYLMSYKDPSKARRVVHF